MAAVYVNRHVRYVQMLLSDEGTLTGFICHLTRKQ